MDSPEDQSSMKRVAVRASIIDSIRACTLAGAQIPKEQLRRKISMPEYLRFAMRDAIKFKNIEAAVSQYDAAVTEVEQPPESPLVVFINSKSGGRHGPQLKGRLQELMTEEQVFDLSTVKPHVFVQYGLGCLEKFAELGDSCAKETREKLRVVVAGGDGTVGWVLGCLGDLHKQGREPVPPTGIIPLGTGNDLSRSFGWGGSFPFNWKSAIKKTLDRACSGQIRRLDSWNLRILMPAGEEVDVPYCLKKVEEFSLDQELGVGDDLPEKLSCYDGVFYNYFSVGMDAQVAYGFHHLRNEKPYLAQGPITNKLVYSGYSCQQGWFFTPCMSDPSLRSNPTSYIAADEYTYDTILAGETTPTCSFILSGDKGPATKDLLQPYKSPAKLTPKRRHINRDPRRNTTRRLHRYGKSIESFIRSAAANRGLNNILRLHIKRANCSEWEQVPVPSSVRSIVALNLHNYASGRNPWGNLKPEYMEKKGFVEAHADDGLLEVFGLKQGWHASFVMFELISAKHLAQAAAIRFEFRGGEWKEGYLQMDGEPWKQPISKNSTTTVEIKRVPVQSTVINGE